MEFKEEPREYRYTIEIARDTETGIELSRYGKVGDITVTIPADPGSYSRCELKPTRLQLDLLEKFIPKLKALMDREAAERAATKATESEAKVA